MLIKWYTFLFFRNCIEFNCFHALQLLLFGFHIGPHLFLFDFSKLFLKEYVNAAYFTTLLSSDSHISSPVRYSYLSLFPDQNPDTFDASLLISYCSFPSQTLSSIDIISFYIYSKRFSLRHEGFSSARITWIAK